MYLRLPLPLLPPSYVLRALRPNPSMVIGQRTRKTNPEEEKATITYLSPQRQPVARRVAPKWPAHPTHTSGCVHRTFPPSSPLSLPPCGRGGGGGGWGGGTSEAMLEEDYAPEHQELYARASTRGGAVPEKVERGRSTAQDSEGTHNEGTNDQIGRGEAGGKLKRV